MAAGQSSRVQTWTPALSVMNSTDKVAYADFSTIYKCWTFTFMVVDGTWNLVVCFSRRWQSRDVCRIFDKTSCHRAMQVLACVQEWRHLPVSSSNSALQVGINHNRFLLLFWYAQQKVHSTNHRHQSPEWTILSHFNCFILKEVLGIQDLLNSLQPRYMRTSQCSPPVFHVGEGSY